MIRASKQVVPKNKVVDHLVLYNFYFDRDSSANMKFGVLDGQNLIKNTQTRYCAPCFCHGDGVQSRRDPAPLKLSTAVAIAKSDFASPFLFPCPCGARSRAEPEQAAAGVRAGQTRRPFSIPRTPTLLASPGTSNAPSPSRPTRSPAESASRPPAAITEPAELRPRRRTPLSGLLPLKSSRR